MDAKLLPGPLAGARGIDRQCPLEVVGQISELYKQNARVEVVDMIHFVVSLAQVLGLSADDVYSLYVKKNEVNFKRQDSGYAEKDENDNKDLTV